MTLTRNVGLWGSISTGFVRSGRPRRWETQEQFGALIQTLIEAGLP
jgi:hypothetical protein